MKRLMMMMSAMMSLAACGGATDTAAEGCGPDALSTCSAPAQPADHYADQGMKYFDSLDESADPESKPDDAEGVARWEWPPWLLLTGYGADMIAAIGGPATYVGYSLGGRAALHVALMYPSVVQALAVIGANPGIDNDEERALRRESDDTVIARLEEVGLDTFLQEWVALPLFGGRPVGRLEMDDRRRNTVAGLASSLRLAGTGAQGSLWPRLRELNMPVLAMAGERDDKFTAIARQIASAVPRGACTIVPAAAHAAHLDQPAAVTAALEALLAR